MEEGKGSGNINPLVKMVPDTVCGLLSLYKFVRPARLLTEPLNPTHYGFSLQQPLPLSGLKTS